MDYFILIINSSYQCLYYFLPSRKKQDFFGARHYLQHTLYPTLYLTYYFKLHTTNSAIYNVKQYFLLSFTWPAARDGLRLPY